MIVLVLTLVMPRDVPDKRLQIPQHSIEECWDQAQDFVRQGLTQSDRDRGAVAVMAGCYSDAASVDM